MPNVKMTIVLWYYRQTMNMDNCRQSTTMMMQAMTIEMNRPNHYRSCHLGLLFSVHYNCNAQQHIDQLHQFTDNVIYIANLMQTLVG